MPSSINNLLISTVQKIAKTFYNRFYSNLSNRRSWFGRSWYSRWSQKTFKMQIVSLFIYWLKSFIQHHKVLSMDGVFYQDAWLLCIRLFALIVNNFYFFFLDYVIDIKWKKNVPHFSFDNRKTSTDFQENKLIFVKEIKRFNFRYVLNNRYVVQLT